MKFFRTTAATGIHALTSQLTAELKVGKRVLWLTSGGSNISLEVDVMANIPAELTRRLTVLPTDERYGPPGHVDSNIEQLTRAGFTSKHARLIPVLIGENLEKTVRQFTDAVAGALAEHDIIIAQLGMGADGHVAGILPHSTASQETEQLACGYEGPDFTRITLTFPSLRRITTAYLFAYGNNKRPALEHLQQSLPLALQPAQILKAIPDTYVYNDQIA